MPRGGHELQARAEHAFALREQARRARRLANGLVEYQDRRTLINFAEMLEARAAALEPAVQSFDHDAAEAIQRAEDDADR